MAGKGSEELGFSLERLRNPAQTASEQAAVSEVRRLLLADPLLAEHPHAAIFRAELEWQEAQDAATLAQLEAEHLQTFLDADTAADTPGQGKGTAIPSPALTCSDAELDAHHIRRFLTSSTIVRFLRAREYKVQKSFKLLLEAVAWRLEERHHLLDLSVLEKEAKTGKMRLGATRDRHDRPILILDNTVENTRDQAVQMQNLGFNMEMVASQCTPWQTDRLCLFIHLEDFALLKSPPLSTTKSTLQIVQSFNPERLGHAIVYQPSWFFRTAWKTISPFLTNETRSKVIFVSGDVAEGSENDTLLRGIIGSDWKRLTGACGKRQDSSSSPGYMHAEYWPRVEAWCARRAAWERREVLAWRRRHNLVASKTSEL